MGEEVVGEIYDEDDDEDFQLIKDSIILKQDNTFHIRGDADLEDCNAVLNLELDEETLKDFGTLSGYLCMMAGEIPSQGDFFMSHGWCFDVTTTDDKKILNVTVSRMLGCEEEDHEADEEHYEQEQEQIQTIQKLVSMSELKQSLVKGIRNVEIASKAVSLASSSEEEQRNTLTKFLKTVNNSYGLEWRI